MSGIVSYRQFFVVAVVGVLSSGSSPDLSGPLVHAESAAGPIPVGAPGNEVASSWAPGSERSPPRCQGVWGTESPTVSS